MGLQLKYFMTVGQKQAAGAFAVALVGAGILAWIFDVFPFRIRNPWVTLRGRQRVFLDGEGRIERGLPKKYRGILMRDLTKVGREARKTMKRQRREERALFRRQASTFRTKQQAVRELLRANPKLRTFLDAHFGRDDEKYLKWLGSGRRGRKPTSDYADGRLDGINYTWNLHGARAANNWTEAIYATIPESRRWEDLEERLAVLEEATGLSLELPPAAAELVTTRADRDRFEEAAEGELEDVYGRAREAAVMQTSGGLEDAPF